MKAKIIISLTAIPTRFLSNEFDLVMNSLLTQKLKPDFVIINLAREYKRKFEYNKIMFNNKIEKYKSIPSVIINIIEKDLGPITKILGLYSLSFPKFDKNDLVIIVDDDFVMKSHLVETHYKYYNEYEYDCAFCPENRIGNEKFFTDYTGSCFGYYSFSIKFRHIKKLYKFYMENIKLDENLWRHDDLIISLFYKYKKLNACCINENFHLRNVNHFNSALHRIPGEIGTRENLDKKFYKIFNLKKDGRY
jgi:hypothetical protein